MEEYSELEQATGSPTAGESEFVHVESIDSAPMDGSSINQDDGVVITRVDNSQDDSSDLKMIDDGGNEEFVDCPDDLISIDGRTDVDESQEAELVPESQQTFEYDISESKKEIFPEERHKLMTELTNLHHQIKNLVKKPPLIGENDGELFTDGEKTLLPLHETIQECFTFIELALREKLQTEVTMRELYATLDTKDRQIEELTVNYNYFLSEVQMVNQCLTEVKSDYHMEADVAKVLYSAREELVDLKRKEYELTHKSSYLENENMKLMEQLNNAKETIQTLNSEVTNLKTEVEVEKTRYTNTREKLNMAVTKGKSLVQQRDSLKQVITEKTSELNKCLIELQDKSEAAELRKDEMVQIETLANSLKENIFQRDMVLKKCEEILSFSGDSEEIQSLSIIDKVAWLANEKNRLTFVCLDIQKVLYESDLKCKLYEQILEEEKIEMNKCLINISNMSEQLQRSEDKTALLKEKLSMAVKKGKSLVQERESMKKQVVEKNSQIEALEFEVKEKEATMSDYRDQISKLSKDVDQIARLESDILLLNEETAEKNSQNEALKFELIQQEATMNNYRDQISKLSKDVDQIAKLESDILLLKEEMSERISQIQSLSFELKEKEATISDYGDQIGKLLKDVDQIAKLESDIEHLEEEMAEKDSQIEALKSELKQQESTMSDYGDQISKLLKEVEQIGKLESDILRSKEEMAEKISHIEALELKLKEKETTISDYRDQISKLSKDVDQIVKLESDIEHSKEEIAEKNSQIEALEFEVKEKEATISDYKDQISKLSKDVDQIAKLESDILRSKEEMAEKNSQIEALKSALKQQESTMSDYRGQISKLSKDVDQIGKLESDILRSKEESAEKNSQIDALQFELKQQEATMSEYRDQIRKLSKDSEKNVFQLTEEKKECQLAKAQAEQELTEAVTTIKSLESTLSISENNVIQLTEEKTKLENIKTRIELELQKSIEEIAMLKKLEDVQSDSAKTIIQLTEEKQELEKSKFYIEENLRKALEEAASESSKFQEILESESSLQGEIKKLKEEVEYQNRKFVDASANIKMLEDALLKAENDISDLVAEKKNSELEILTLSSFVESLQVVLKDGYLLTLVKQSIEKKFEMFVEMDHCVKEIKDYFDSDQLQDYSSIEENFQLSTLLPVDFDNDLNTKMTNINSADANDISSYTKKTLELLNSKNQILTDELNRFSTFIDELTASIFIKLEAIKNIVPITIDHTKSLEKNVNNLQSDKENMSGIITELRGELEKTRSMYEKVNKENGIFQNKVLKLEKELEASQKVRDEMGIKLEENEIFQNKVLKLEKDLEGSQKIRDEMGIKLKENKEKEDEWNRREAELNKQITALVKDHEAESDLLSVSEVKSLISKINEIATPFPNRESEQIDSHDSDPVKKLFYIVDNVNELLNHITFLYKSKEELHSTLTKQALEIEYLKEELNEGIQYKKEYENIKRELLELSIWVKNIIKKLGGDESDADVAVLEKLIQGVVLESENSKEKANDLGVKLLEAQKVVEELANKVKLFEDLDQNRTSLLPHTIINERGVTESSSLPPRSEISEVEDPGSIRKRDIPLVASAHARTSGRGSNDHLALSIDPESEHLINRQETVEDKGRLFKSLHTSGLVPPQGKIIADRLDGIWVSGSRVLMNRPRARLGLIAYWLVLHLWLLGTLL